MRLLGMHCGIVHLPLATPSPPVRNQAHGDTHIREHGGAMQESL